jgi:hypothetical protein
MPPKAYPSLTINYTPSGTAASSLSSRGSSCRPYYSNNNKGASYSYNYPLATLVLTIANVLITFLSSYLSSFYSLIASY